MTGVCRKSLFCGAGNIRWEEIPTFTEYGVFCFSQNGGILKNRHKRRKK